MSDCVRNKFNEKEDFQVLLGKGNPGELSCHQNSRWMAHWTRASSSAYGKSCSPLEDASNNTCTKDSGISLFDLTKSSVAERLMMGGNYGEICMQNVQQLNSNMSGEVWQEAEQKRIERRDGSFQSSMVQMQRGENFYAKTVVSETLSVRRLPDLPLDFQRFVNSDENLDSDWNQLPMLSINQKVDNILNPKRRSAAGIVFDDLFVPQQTPELNVAPSNLMEFMNQPHELQSHQRTDRIMDHCKPAGGVIRLREDPTCLTSDPAGKKLKLDNNSLSDYVIHEPDTDHYFANPNQEPLWKCSDMTFKLSEYNGKGQSVGAASRNQKSQSPAVLHETQPLNNFSDACKGKGPCLFEMLTIPSNLQSSYAKDSEKTSGLNIDSHWQSAGINSSLAQKDNGCAEEENQQLETLSTKGSPGYDLNVNQDVSSKADFCMPGTDTMDLDPPPLQPSRTRNQTPNSATQPLTDTEPSDRWLKRLLHDPHVPGSKRLKIGDSCPVGGSSGTTGTDFTDHVAERSVHCWLGRLCKDGGRAPGVSREGLHRRRTQIKPDVPARGLGGHFPSIKTMAMMGRVMSKVRPLDRQRKGPCVMW